MNEWKELQIDNLPPDILTGDYLFGVKNNHIDENYLLGEIIPSIYQDSMVILMRVFKKTDIHYYRKPKLKQPTPKEITTKWWFISKNLLWKRVESINNFGEYFIAGTGWLHRSWFIDKKSADIPEE